MLERFFVRDEAARRLQRAWLTHILNTGQLSSDDAKVKGGGWGEASGEGEGEGHG